MALFKRISDYIFANRGDAEASMNRSFSFVTYSRALRNIAVAGILLGVGCFWRFMHYPGAAWILLMATAALFFMCLVMMTFGMHSTGSLLMWLSIAVVLLGNLFQVLHWPGRLYLGFWGIPHILAIIFAIGYIVYLPQEYKWAKKAMTFWTILPQLALLGIYYGRIYVQHAYYPNFTPALSYSSDNIYRQLGDADESKLVLFYGLLILACSLYLYIVARRQCKKV